MAKDSSFGQIWNQVNSTAIIQTVFSWPTKIGSYGFLPLITRKHHMVCELDILFLRREQPGALVHDGDLDNRLKVLFDGLRMHLNNDELEGLRDEPEPFCCLLADDSLITAVNVRTEQWYQPPAPDTSPSNVRLVIDVLIRVTRVTYANIARISDLA